MIGLNISFLILSAKLHEVVGNLKFLYYFDCIKVFSLCKHFNIFPYDIL